jgi:hypothetical protein
MLHIDDLLERFRLPDIQTPIIGFLPVRLIHLAHVTYSYLGARRTHAILVGAVRAHNLFAEVALGHGLPDLDLLLTAGTLLRFACAHN